MNAFWLFMVVHAWLLKFEGWNYGERQVRVVYCEDPYDIFGWYVEMRGKGYFFWVRLHMLPLTSREDACAVAYEHAKRTGGCILCK